VRKRNYYQCFSWSLHIVVRKNNWRSINEDDACG
jgi:hypothetical protein